MKYIIIVLVLSFSLFATEDITNKGGNINITVTNNNIPVSGAVIKVKYPEKYNILTSLTTDGSGRASTRVLFDGDYVVELVAGSNYLESNNTISVSKNGNFSTAFNLAGKGIKAEKSEGFSNGDFSYKFAGYYNSDVKGNYFSQTGLILYDKTSDYFNAVLAVFLSQNYSMSDSISFELRQANVSYVNDWLRVSLGRVDYSNLVSPCYYFGRYEFMSNRRIQGFFVTSNFLLKTGVSEEKLVEIPPTALTFGIVPNFYNNFATSLYDNPFWFAQFRTRLKLYEIMGLKDLSIALVANYAQSRDVLFWYSSLSGQPSLSFTADITANAIYSVYGEYAMQNANEPSTTTLAIGTRMKISDLTEGIIDNIILEVQLPQSPSLSNAFTGGNYYNPTEASLPQNVFFAKVAKSFGSLEISVSATNNVGDYSFARPSASSLFNSIPVPLFKGNEDPSSSTEFYSRDYSVIAYRLNVAYKF